MLCLSAGVLLTVLFAVRLDEARLVLLTLEFNAVFIHVEESGCQVVREFLGRLPDVFVQFQTPFVCQFRVKYFHIISLRSLA